jgi:hypothetical protein
VKTRRTQPALPALSEKAWQAQVIDLAHLYGWNVAHFRKARTKRGWRTPVAADGKGWLDLVLVRDRVIYAECKTDDGAMTAEQRLWFGWLETAGQEVYVWRPRDFEAIKRILAKSFGR